MDADYRATQASRERRRSLRVLVVEDECLVGLTMAEFVREFGHTPVGPAFTLAEARHLAEVAEIDAARVDVNMFGVLAWEVADRLHQRGIPFAFVTGYSNLPSRRYDKVMVLNKPFSSVDLQRALESLSIASEQAATKHVRSTRGKLAG